jgi:glyoxylase-like metal-dependent hydrolase (beta-lactamase superfamily II)
VGPGLWAIDTGYVRPRFDAVHLRICGDRAALIDAGVGASAPRVLAAIDALGLARDQVQYLILTHVHLDHAGGAGQLMAALPAAQLVVHPRGARHMVDPARLVAGTVAVYGEAAFRELYGEILPIPEHRVRATSDLDRLPLGGIELELLHTPGHAKHHQVVVDPELGAFTGDTFGIAYPELQGPAPFLVATTTPTDFDLGALEASIRRIAATGAPSAFLTHYSRVDGVAELAEPLIADARALWGLSGQTSDMNTLVEQILAHWAGRLRAAGAPGDAAAWRALLAGDATLNAMGLLHARGR